jgi:hypothetical protein
VNEFGAGIRSMMIPSICNRQNRISGRMGITVVFFFSLSPNTLQGMGLACCALHIDFNHECFFYRGVCNRVAG